MNLLPQPFGDAYLKILRHLPAWNICSYSYLEGENTTQPEAGMSKIIEEGSIHVSLNHHQKKHIPKKVQLKNTFVTSLIQNNNNDNK